VNAELERLRKKAPCLTLYNIPVGLKGLTKTKENLCIIGVAADIRTGHEQNNKKRYQSKSVFSYPVTNDRNEHFEIHNLKIYEHPVLCRRPISWHRKWWDIPDDNTGVSHTGVIRPLSREGARH